MISVWGPDRVAKFTIIAYTIDEVNMLAAIQVHAVMGLDVRRYASISN